MKLPPVALLCACATACAWEVLDASYATAREAIDAGMVGKGWVPEWMPLTATDLREVHNLDTNVSALSFAVPPATALRLPAQCRSVAYADTVEVRIRRDWWPEVDELERSYRFFRCPGEATDHEFVGIRQAGDRVLHWRTYAR